MSFGHVSPHDQGLVALVLRRWRIMGLTLVMVLGAGGTALMLMPKNYEASSKLLIMRSEQRLGGISVVREAMPELSMSSNPLYTQVELIRSQPVFEDVIQQLEIRGADGNLLPAAALADMVEVMPIAQTDLIAVSCVSGDPVLAQRIVTAVCEAYLRHTEGHRVGGVRDGLKLVDEQLAAAQARLLKSENDLMAYKRKSNSIALREEIQAMVGQVSTLNHDLRTQQIDLARASARAANLRRQLGMSAQQALHVAAAAHNPRIRALQDQLVEAESSPLHTQGLGRNHPEMVALNQRVARLKQAIDAEVRKQTGLRGSVVAIDEVRLSLLRDLAAAETEVISTQASLRAAEGKRKAMMAEMTALPGAEIEMGRLTREVQVASDVYQSLLQKREEARLSLGIALTSARVVEPAEVPSQPISPLKGPAAPVWLLASAAMAFGVGALKDMVGRPVRPDELADTLPELKICATLPRLSWSERRQGELPAATGGAPHYVESLKTLSMALETHLSGEGGRAIALTSSAPGEGKSVTLANLALCLAEAGHRVLLVDADFRRPRVHELFKLPSMGRGLAEVLLDQAKPEDVIRSDGRIDLVTAGTTKLVSNVATLRLKLKPVLDSWKQTYDFVLIDLPPLVMMAEVAHTAKHTDGLLLLANLQKVPADSIGPGIHQLRALHCPLVGIIAMSQMIGKPEGGYYYLVSGEGTAS